MSSAALTSAQGALLLGLAKRPRACAGAERTTVEALAALGLVRLEPGQGGAPRHEITPAGRRFIALNGAALRPRPVRSPRACDRRTPEPVSVRRFRGTVVTVADMQVARWLVVSQCLTCADTRSVSLDLMVWTLGAKTVLWDRREPCQAEGCGGARLFCARPPGVGTYEALSSL
ncbi:MAG: hypothetical protein P4L73_01015 [Caulobacteraceae bacterium]|nr:hypothetical protein [Caulobacteraceae bacterium]